MSAYREILRLRLRHSYYQGDPVPIEIAPSDPAAFDRQGLLLRRQGADVIIVTDADDVADTIEFALTSREPKMLALTIGTDWKERPVIDAPIGQDDVTLDATRATSGPQITGQSVVALLRAAPHTDGRVVTVWLTAPSAHWAYHIVGPGSDVVLIEDPDGEIIFDPIGAQILPDARTAHVLRSRSAMDARARPTQRFALKTPGPFGPKTVIPVLPAAGPDFVSVTDPETSQTLVQSDIYVSIF